MQMYSKIFLYALVCSVFFFPFSDSLAKTEVKKPHVGVFLFKADDIYIASVATAIETFAKTKMDITIFDAKNDQVIQTEQLRKFLATNPEAVAINLVDIKISQQILNMVKKKNIPLIFFNKEPDLNIVKEYALARYVGTKASQSGIIQGEIIAELWMENPQFDRNKDGICHFLMLQGGLDNPEALMRSRVSVQRPRALGIKMQQLGDTLLCAWDVSCAHKATKLALDVYKDQVDFIISNNDGMALGAIQALQEIGFNTKGGEVIPVVGIDATQEAKQAIADGYMQGTVLQDAKSMANAVVTLLYNAILKKPFLDNLPYSWDQSGIAIRIPYRAYELSTYPVRENDK